MSTTTVNAAINLGAYMGISFGICFVAVLLLSSVLVRVLTDYSQRNV